MPSKTASFAGATAVQGVVGARDPSHFDYSNPTSLRPFQ